jgi:acyl-CoA reductase-like NAD-dependent aldehyde dehydrogenase
MAWPRTCIWSPSAVDEDARARIEVRKTYKLFIGGEFPRSESGRSYSADGVWAARASRKDLRDAVKAARGAVDAWSGRTAYNRGQILYRIAEMMEGRRSQFVAEGATPDEVDASIDRWVWYAGWSDKIHQLAGTVNPVAGPFFDFTVPEPVGVVGIVAPEQPPLLGLVSRLAPVLTGGNVAVVLASEASPRSAVTLAEVLATSDLPAGVVAVLTGLKSELLPWLASHRDVDSVDLTGAPHDLATELEAVAADSVKRIVRAADPLAESPYDVIAFLEMKTVWHPIGR